MKSDIDVLFAYVWHNSGIRESPVEYSTGSSGVTGTMLHLNVNKITDISSC